MPRCDSSPFASCVRATDCGSARLRQHRAPAQDVYAHMVKPMLLALGATLELHTGDDVESMLANDGERAPLLLVRARGSAPRSVRLCRAGDLSDVHALLVVGGDGTLAGVFSGLVKQHKRKEEEREKRERMGIPFCEHRPAYDPRLAWAVGSPRAACR